MAVEIADTIAHMRAERARLNGSVGVVPTMGALHEGHLALIRAAHRDNDAVVVTIFVNPTQFNDPRDLAAYPRDTEHDLDLLRSEHVDVVFMPLPDEMYSATFQTYVTVEQVARGLEGAHRPGHFRGVATIVAKLLNLTQPHRAYFGQKDAQQVAVIRQMIADLNIPVDMVVCPTVRESDGLAMSSRNRRLSPTQREAAPVLYRALQAAVAVYEAGERDSRKLRRVMRDVLTTEPLAEIDYVSVADAKSLKEFEGLMDHPALLSLAARIGPVRLIDNLVLPG